MLNVLSNNSVFFQERKIAKSLYQVIGASLLIALCAQISIPLPYTPVPLTCQTFAIMLIGTCLGSKKGLLAVLAYLLEGIMGLPFFSNGAAGPLVVLGAKGGYFLGFFFQVYLAGLIADRKMNPSSFKAISLLLLSAVVQMGFGTLWLSFYFGLHTAFLLGFCPFIGGEFVKALTIGTFSKAIKWK